MGEYTLNFTGQAPIIEVDGYFKVIVTCDHLNVVVDAKVEATCTQSGWTEGTHCTACGTAIVVQNEIPATGHTEGDPVTVTEPTATAPGLTMICCETCGELIRMEEIPAVGPLRLPGDANDDSVVNIMDALLTLQYSVGWDVEINLLNADVNADNAANIMDALLILQYSVGWDIVLL